MTRSEESYRVCVCVLSRNLKQEAVWARFGLLRHKKIVHSLLSSHAHAIGTYPERDKSSPQLSKLFTQDPF